MSWWGTRIAAAALAAALLACLLGACGGSDSTAGSDGESSTTTAPGSSADSGSPGGERGRGGEGAGAESKPNTAPLEVSGGGSGQFRVQGGDNSIQEFGEESSEDELEEAAVALHAYFVSRAEEDWRAACARLSENVVVQLRLLGEHSKSGKKACRVSLAALTPSVPQPMARESTVVDAGSLRVEEDRGFLIYRGPEGTVYAINMADEDGWKVGALAPVPLS